MAARGSPCARRHAIRSADLSGRTSLALKRRLHLNPNADAMQSQTTGSPNSGHFAPFPGSELTSPRLISHLAASGSITAGTCTSTQAVDDPHISTSTGPQAASVHGYGKRVSGECSNLANVDTSLQASWCDRSGCRWQAVSVASADLSAGVARARERPPERPALAARSSLVGAATLTLICRVLTIRPDTPTQASRTLIAHPDAHRAHCRQGGSPGPTGADHPASSSETPHVCRAAQSPSPRCRGEGWSGVLSERRSRWLVCPSGRGGSAQRFLKHGGEGVSSVLAHSAI